MKWSSGRRLSMSERTESSIVAQSLTRHYTKEITISKATCGSVETTVVLVSHAERQGVKACTGAKAYTVNLDANAVLDQTSTYSPKRKHVRRLRPHINSVVTLPMELRWCMSCQVQHIGDTNISLPSAVTTGSGVRLRRSPDRSCEHRRKDVHSSY